MEENNYFQSAATCERRFKEGEKLYRLQAAALASSGEPAPKKNLWFWNEDMHFMMEKDVTVHAPVTISCGSTSVRTVQPTSSAQALQQPTHIGKSRVPQLKRPASQKQLDRQALQKMADALEFKNKILMKKLGIANVDEKDLDETYQEDDPAPFS